MGKLHNASILFPTSHLSKGRKSARPGLRRPLSTDQGLQRLEPVALVPRRIGDPFSPVGSGKRWTGSLGWLEAGRRRGGRGRDTPGIGTEWGQMTMVPILRDAGLSDLMA